MSGEGSVFVQPIAMKKIKCKQKILAKLSCFILFIMISFFSSASQFFFEDLNKEEVLPANKAFSFSARKEDGTSIILTWEMKENCFLYKDKFNILSNGNKLFADLIFGEPERINDIYFGEVDVFFNSVEKEIKIKSDIKEMEISYQGCNEKGFCYPVITKAIDIKNL